MKEIKAPDTWDYHYYKPKLFLAGSIEMGQAAEWQSQVIAALAEFEGEILNPRREHWDANWSQSKDNPPFAQQVNWELAGLKRAEYVLFYFDPNTKSPVTMLELGIILATADNYAGVYVVCPAGFYRKGNVDITCKRFYVKVYETLEEALDIIKMDLSQ